jgi:hypothetical protein
MKRARRKGEDAKRLERLAKRKLQSPSKSPGPQNRRRVAKSIA